METPVPQSVDERLISLAVNRPGGAREVFRRLKDSSHVEGTANKWVFDACRTVYERSTPKPMVLSIDIIKGELQAMGVYESIDAEHLSRCLESPVNARELETVIDVVKRRSTNHEITKAMDELQKSADTDPTKRIEIAERIAELSKQKDETYQSKILSLDDWYAEIDTIEQMPESVPTGFPILDQRLGGGLTTGGYHLVASPTGSGKTILMLTMWKHLLDAGVPAIYINYEIARQVFMKFAFAQFTGVNVLRPDMDPDILINAKKVFKDKITDLHERGLLLVSDPMQGSSKMWEDVEDMLRSLVEDNGAKAIFFDTINSVSAATRKGQDARWNEYEKIAISAERMCIELNIATCFSVQMDKQSQQGRREETDKTPKLQDVAGSKTLTEKAVSVIHLHRTDIYDQTKTIDYSELHVTKNRLLGQEMGMHPIRVKYNTSFKSLYELPMHEQEVERLPLAEVYQGTFVTGVKKHPTLMLDPTDGREL